MLKSIHQTVLFLLAVSVLVLPGCTKSDKPDGFPDIFPCEIKVLQDGSPLAGASVTLMGDQPWAVGGGTDDSGVAKIFTHGKYEGAPVGKYKILVSKRIVEGAPTQEQLNDPSFTGGGETQYNVVDKKFGVQATTTLEIEVSSGKNSETVDVGKAVREALPKL